MLTAYLSVLALQPFTHACFSFRCVWNAFRYYDPVALPRSCLSGIKPCPSSQLLVPGSSLPEIQETRQLTDHQDHSYGAIHTFDQFSIEVFPYPTHELTINDPPVVTMWRLFTGRSPPLPSQSIGRTLAVVCSRASYQ
jgi:hypothetical protein